MAAGIAVGIFEGLLVFLVVPSPVWPLSFEWTAGGVVLGFGVAAAVAIAVMRALMKPPPRASRVPVHGVEARLANLLGRMVNISATGALVSVNGTLPVGTEWPLVLELNSHPELRVRIARVIESVSLDAGVTPRDREVTLGVLFGELTPTAQHVVVQLCDGVSPNAVRIYATDASVHAGQREHAIREQTHAGPD